MFKDCVGLETYMCYMHAALGSIPRTANIVCLLLYRITIRTVTTFALFIKRTEGMNEEHCHYYDTCVLIWNKKWMGKLDLATQMTKKKIKISLFKCDRLSQEWSKIWGIDNGRACMYWERGGVSLSLHTSWPWTHHPPACQKAGVVQIENKVPYGSHSDHPS